jgi:hypothetical protein
MEGIDCIKFYLGFDSAMLAKHVSHPRGGHRLYAKRESRDGIFKLLRSPGIDSKESIPPAYVAWRAVKTSLFLIGS